MGGSSTVLDGAQFFQNNPPTPNFKVRPTPPQNLNLNFSEYTSQNPQTVMGTNLTPLLQQYLSYLNYNVDSVP